MTTVLGIDPGSRKTGFGLVRKNGSALSMVAAGRISTSPKASLAQRLCQVYEGLSQVLDQYAPDVVSVEDVFYAKNVKSAMRLGHARGVALLAAASAGLDVFEYSPASIKMAVVGYGRADKAQIGLMVKKILKIEQDLAEDASDALAAAICHLHQTPRLQGIQS